MSPLDYAIKKNDFEAVKFLIEQYTNFLPENANSEEDTSRFLTLPSSHFELAMSLGRTEIMGYFIAKTGAEFPFSTLMKMTGATIDEIPKVCKDLSSCNTIPTVICSANRP